MKISIKDNIKEVTKQLSRVQKKQIPFAAMLTLNDVAFMARKELRKQAEKKFENPIPFTLNGFQVVRSKLTQLTSIVFIESKRYEYMKFEVFGGTRMPKARAIVVPTSKMAVNKYGNMTKNKIKTLLGQDNVFSKTINGKPGIWQQNKDRSMTRLASYKDNAPYKPIFHFEKIVKGIVNSKINAVFEKRIREGLARAR
jgi:hypothetical protein